MTLPLLYIPSVPPPLWILLILCFSPLATFAAIEKNVTVDDTDSSILYTGTFHLGSPTNLDYGGNHMLSEDIGATAKFTFTGTAVYMLSPKWPYGVDTAVSIDGGPSTTVDLVDHAAPQTTGGSESLAYSVVWSKTGLTNTSHTVQLSRANNYVIVDGFMWVFSSSPH
ncbi:hypothetical protein DL96DRAFT_1051980 [Flagelloscypha sp. PMI_526]|nr:hypothetical protein DL96DRAFT_1051980 [Flagelloscypha sp. PMI_526]